MKDDDLRRHVAAELSWDPQVGSGGIEISAASGMVTLRGTVTSLWLKRAGGRAAARVRGVTRIANELQVQIPDKERRDDEDLRGDVLETLMLDVSVPTTVDAQAQDGFVTLTGTAQWHYQREAAELRAANVPGVAGIANAIGLTQVPPGPPSASPDPATPPSASPDPATPPSASPDPATPPSASPDPATPPKARDARDAIHAAFRRNAALEGNGLSVETSAAGLVILSGTVRSWAAHDHAVAAAWSAPGVSQVEDRIRVESGP